MVHLHHFLHKLYLGERKHKNHQKLITKRTFLFINPSNCMQMIPPEAYIIKRSHYIFLGSNCSALSLSTNTCHLVVKLYCENEIFELALLQLLLYSLQCIIPDSGRGRGRECFYRNIQEMDTRMTSNIYATFFYEVFSSLIDLAPCFPT